jgi:integrase
MITKIGTRTLLEVTPRERPYHVRDSELTGYLLRVQPSGVITYWFEYRAGRSRRRVKIARVGQITPAQARDRARELAADVVKGNFPHETRAAIMEPTLEQFLVEKYEPWITASKKGGAKTVTRIRARFAFLLRRQLSSIDVWAIERWRTERLKAGTTRQTVNKDVCLIKAALSRAVEWDILQDNPLRKVKPFRVENCARTRFLSKEEEANLRKALTEREADIRAGRDRGNAWRNTRGYELYPSLSQRTFVDHLRPMVILSLNTGMRRGEVCQLRRENIDLSKRTLTIPGAYSKSGKTRVIPLNDEAHQTLSLWLRENHNGVSPLVFPSKDGRPLAEIKTAWSRVLSKAGIEQFRWHDLRHSFASNLVIAGVPLNTVRELLGHSHPLMTVRYSHLNDETKAEAVAKLRPAHD